jgi:hypothetical protein
MRQSEVVDGMKVEGNRSAFIDSLTAVLSPTIVLRAHPFPKEKMQQSMFLHACNHSPALPRVTPKGSMRSMYADLVLLWVCGVTRE